MTKTRAEVFSELALLLLGEEVTFMDTRDIPDNRLYEHLEHEEPEEEQDDSYADYCDWCMDDERERYRD